MWLFSLSILIVRYFLCLTKLCSNRPWKKCVCSWASHAARCYSWGHFGTTFWTVLDQYGAKKPILFGLSLATIGWLALTILLEMPVLLGFVAGHVTYMIGLGFAYSNMMTTGMSLLEEKDFGDGNTLFNTLQQFFWRYCDGHCSDDY